MTQVVDAVCKKSWPSWYEVPCRGYPQAQKVKSGEKPPDDDYLVVYDPSLLPDGEEKEETMEVLGVGSSALVFAKYVPDGLYDVLPTMDAAQSELKAYRLFVDALDNDNQAMLTRFRGKRYAIISNRDLNRLLAVRLVDRRSAPRQVPVVQVSEAERGTMQKLLKELTKKDLQLPEEKDPEQAYIAKALMERAKKTKKPDTRAEIEKLAKLLGA